MKLLVPLLSVLVMSCSISSLERGGWVQSGPQSSKSMTVTSGGFIMTRGSSSQELFLGVRLNSIPAGAKFLRITFPDAKTKGPGEQQTIRLAGPKEYDAKSRPIGGLKYLESYPVVIQLLSDRSGGSVLEEVTQLVRFELSPAAQAAFAGAR